MYHRYSPNRMMSKGIKFKRKGGWKSLSSKTFTVSTVSASFWSRSISCCNSRCWCCSILYWFWICKPCRSQRPLSQPNHPTWMSTEIGSWPLHFTRKYPKVIFAATCSLHWNLLHLHYINIENALCHLKPTWLEPATQPHCTPVVAGQGLAPVGLCTIDDSVNNDSTLRYSTRRIHISTYSCLNVHGKSYSR